MKISVIVPVYNNEKTILRCIKSIVSQTLADIEIIIVNDGSDDDTPDILNTLTDNRIRVITQENKGQGYARNCGMAAALGDYIAFVDADDTIEPDMLDKMYELAEKYKADIVQCNLLDIYPDGETRVQLKMKDCLVEVNDTAKYISEYLATCIHSYEVCNKLFKREFIFNNNLIFEDTKKYFSEDILFNMEAVKYLKNIYFYSKPCYNYYQHCESHMHRSADERLIKMSLLFEDYLKTADEKIKSSVSYLMTMVMLYNVGSCDNRELSYKALKRICPAAAKALRSVRNIKHKIFLIMILLFPVNIKWKLAKILVRGKI